MNKCCWCEKDNQCSVSKRRECAIRDYLFFTLDVKKCPYREKLKGLLRGHSIDTEADLDYVVDILIDAGVKL